MERSEIPDFRADEQLSPSLAARRLATLVAQRLDAVVPRPYRVEADDGTVWCHVGDAWDQSIGLANILDQELDPDAAPGERHSFAWYAASVSGSVLSHVQDAVSEMTRDPWPRLPNGGMALPGARTDGARVFLWYGPHYDREDDAVLSFAPIALDALLAAE